MIDSATVVCFLELQEIRRIQVSGVTPVVPDWPSQYGGCEILNRVNEDCGVCVKVCVEFWCVQDEGQRSLCVNERGTDPSNSNP